MEEHIYSYIKQENPDKLMKKIKKELHSVLPVDHCLVEFEVIKKCTFLKKKLFLSVYENHIIAFKEKGQKSPLSIIFYEFALKVEWIFQNKQKEGQKNNKIIGFKFHNSDCDQSVEFSSIAEKELLLFYQILNCRINIVGFHENYKALKKIGKGSFASVTTTHNLPQFAYFNTKVYLVSHKETGMQYAVKAFSKEAVFSQENGKVLFFMKLNCKFLKESLINELKIMRMLDHPNILKLYEVCETENSLYMVMDLLQGGSLIDKIREKNVFTEVEAIPLMKGMLKAIQHAHSRGIMHRDLKPENILFRTANFKEDDIVLGDFGLSTVINEKKYLFFRCGTPGYVAPEVINLKDENATYSEVCDVFSLGVIFHIIKKSKGKMNSLNSVDSPLNNTNSTTLPLSNNKNPKRHTVDVVNFKQNSRPHADSDLTTASNNSHLLVTRETVMNGQTKTIEFVVDSSQNSSEIPIKEVNKFRKESLQVKIFKNPTVETCSPFLRRDLEEYKNEKENDNERVVSPMIIIRENDEEEEKKVDG